MRLSSLVVPVVIGSSDQIERLNALLVGGMPRERPVLVIGGGRVGRAVAGALRCRNVPVHIIDKKEGRGQIMDSGASFFQGDAADREVLRRAGTSRPPGSGG